MPLPFGSLVVAAGICGTLSFASLAASLGTEYWFIIEMNPANASDAEDWSSHSGLWSVGEGEKMKAEDSATYSESEHGMHSAIVVVLPLSLVLMLFGGICGLVSSLARSPVLLARTATYFFLCSLLTLSGASLYIVYSHRALAEAERLAGPQGLASVRTSFGWSLGLAWLSYGLELLAGALLLVAARAVQLQRGGGGGSPATT
ncbi:transmembrane protein 235 [Gasterosteus aculeatus]